jgi:hypothetical protein
MLRITRQAGASVPRCGTLLGLCGSRDTASEHRQWYCFVRDGGGFRMRKTIATVTLSLALTSSAAMAQERTGDAALGALSGALVLGPVGAVAGALVGYTAGPSIASAWGLRRSSSPRRSTTAEPAPNASASSPAQRREAYAAMPAAAPPPSVPSSGSAPPVQPLE